MQSKILNPKKPITILSPYLFLIFLAIQTIFLSSCSSPPLNTQLDESWMMPNMREYKKAIRQNTSQVRKYDGFYNKFDISITRLNQDIRIKQLKIKANYSQWPTQKADEERSKLIESMQNESVYFVSSFTPKRDLNNLTMKDIGWNASLDVDGTIYPGKFKSYANKTYKLETLYEHHTLWHKGYILEFDIPTSISESKPQTLTLTSPYGFAIYKFN